MVSTLSIPVQKIGDSIENEYVKNNRAALWNPTSDKKDNIPESEPCHLPESL